MEQSEREKVIITRMVNKIIAFQDIKKLQGGCHYFTLYLYYWLNEKYNIMATPIIGQLKSKEDGTILGNHSWLMYQEMFIDPTAYYIHGSENGTHGNLLLFDKVIRHGNLSYDYISSPDQLNNDKLTDEAVRIHELILNNDIKIIKGYLKNAPGMLFANTRKALS